MWFGTTVVNHLLARVDLGNVVQMTSPGYMVGVDPLMTEIRHDNAMHAFYVEKIKTINKTAGLSQFCVIKKYRKWFLEQRDKNYV